MGIPIDGSINQFESKLMSKGCSKDDLEYSSSRGCRTYDGTFAGNEVSICVFYNERTNLVYRVKAIINRITEERADQKYQEIKDMLIQKYGQTGSGETDHENKKAFYLILPCSDFLDKYKPYSDTNNSLAKCGYKGEIDVFISKNDDSKSTFCYYVHIDYNDAINKDKHQEQNLEDL